MPSRAPALFPIAVVFLFWTCSVGGPAWAATLDLVTDRPDQTESSVTVPPGFVQIEVGWTREGDEEGAARTRSDAVPGLLTRIGLTERVELRVGHAGHIWERVSAGGPDLDVNGLGDAEVGVKVKLREEGPSWRPDAAVIAATTLPTGADAHSGGRADPSFRFSLAHSLAERLSLGYNAGAAWSTSAGPAGERETEALLEYTATVGVALAERLGCFVEIFGDAPLTDGAPDASVSWDGGVTLLVRENVQLDLAGGVGLSDEAPDWFVGLGASARLPR